MAFVGENPWWVGTDQDNGQAVPLGDKPVTAAEMLVASGNDWRVQLATMRAEIVLDGKRVTTTVPNMKAVVREDTRAVLGCVSKLYEPVQNSAAFAFFDEVVGEGRAMYHTSGSLGEGEKVWILARLPEDIVINGVDKVESYLALFNAHDGSMSFRMHYTPIRVVCQNTWNVAVREGKRQGGGYRRAHFRGITGRLNADDARKALGLAHEHLRTFEEQAAKMAQQPMSDRELEGFLQRIFPMPRHLMIGQPTEPALKLLMEPKPELYTQLGVPAVISKRRELVRRLFAEGKGNAAPEIAGTRWAAANAVSEFTDYLHGWDRRRSESLLFGYGAAQKQRAWDLLVAAPS